MVLKRLFGNDDEEQHEGQNLVLPLILSFLVLISLGLGLVWINSESTRMSYNIHDLGKEVRKREELSAKLTVERDSLLAGLGSKAEALGLRTALPGQVRHMPALPKNETD